MDKIICDECGKEIIPGMTNGMPNGAGFVLENGKVIYACQDCIIKASEGEDFKFKGKEGD